MNTSRRGRYVGGHEKELPLCRRYRYFAQAFGWLRKYRSVLIALKFKVHADGPARKVLIWASMKAGNGSPASKLVSTKEQGVSLMIGRRWHVLIQAQQEHHVDQDG